MKLQGRLSCEGGMGTEQVSGKPNSYGCVGCIEWEEKEGKKQRRWGGGSHEGLREGVVWWVQKKGRARHMLQGGPQVQCKMSGRKR